VNSNDEILSHLSTADLTAFATALESGWIAPSSPEKLFRTYAGDHAPSLKQWLREISPAVFTPSQVARMLHAVGAGRARDQILAPDLVVSGPDVPGVPTADTHSVVQSLFQEAKSEVILAGYAFYNGRALFERLHEQRTRNPELKIIFHVDVPRPPVATKKFEDLLKNYVEEFRMRHWPWEPLPELYFDLRALDSSSKIRASLHAKVVSIDRRKVLITSANFTEAAQQKNIELGVLCSLPHLATQVCSYLEGLRSSGKLRRIPTATRIETGD
jgi:phosphatidylserine/phosphatidylglycerophosphate/cardiolipin synthase-like enzyme